MMLINIDKIGSYKKDGKNIKILIEVINNYNNVVNSNTQIDKAKLYLVSTTDKYDEELFKIVGEIQDNFILFDTIKELENTGFLNIKEITSNKLSYIKKCLSNGIKIDIDYL